MEAGKIMGLSEETLKVARKLEKLREKKYRGKVIVTFHPEGEILSVEHQEFEYVRIE